MPASVLNREQVPGQRLAVTANALYLANMFPLPVIGFLILLWLYFRHGQSAPPLARHYLRQTVNATIWAAILLFGLNLLVLLLGGYGSTYVGIVLFLYFVTLHSAFILVGVVGLIKAMNGEDWRWPLVGDWPFREGR